MFRRMITVVLAKRAHSSVSEIHPIKILKSGVVGVCDGGRTGRCFSSIGGGSRVAFSKLKEKSSTSTPANVSHKGFRAEYTGPMLKADNAGRILQLSKSLSLSPPKLAKLFEKEAVTVNQEEEEVAVVDGGEVKAGKKRSNKRRSQIDPKFDMKHSFPVFAYATCEELDLELLNRGLVVQDLYIPTVLSEDMDDVIHVSAKYKISDESREIFFFRDGAVVFWNMPESECMNVLKFLKKYEHESYDTDQVTQEVEYMRYCYHDQGSSRLSKGRIVLNGDSGNQILEKYAFANAMASSVKLGIWESTLDKFVDSIADITEVLKRAEKLKLSREEVLQKTGELYSLRHELNLNSDLLDTPDFYWERDRLENIYQKTCNYLNMNRRTKVLNEKMAQCSELLELIATHLTDIHHTRLEWMIILLIMIEVGFEILHVVERHFM